MEVKREYEMKRVDTFLENDQQIEDQKEEESKSEGAIVASENEAWSEPDLMPSIVKPVQTSVNVHDDNTSTHEEMAPMIASVANWLNSKK